MRFLTSSCCAKTNQGAFFVAFARSLERVLKEIPAIVERLRVAPDVRFRAAAIFAKVSFPAIPFKERKIF
jgi:hypothetical protein